MEKDLHSIIIENLKAQETETLVEIWRLHDLDEWRPEVFDYLEDILLERLGELPELDNSVYQKVLLDQAEHSFSSNDLEKALKESEEAIQQAPDLANGYYLHSLILQKLDFDSEALADMYTASRLDPTCRDYWREIVDMEWIVDEIFEESETKQHLDAARDYFLDGDLQKAIAEMDLAEQFMPVFAPAWNYRGMIFEGMQLLESAIDCYLQAVYLNPRFWNARENLGNARKNLIEDMHRRLPEQTIDTENGETMLIPNFGSKRLLGDLNINDSLPSWFYLNEYAYVMKGTPGHRWRPGRSGYDPLDLDFEEARVWGILIKKLFTGRLRTHNPFYWILLANITGIFAIPFVILLIGAKELDPLSLMGIFILTSPFIACFLALTYNIISSLFTEIPVHEKNTGSTFY